MMGEILKLTEEEFIEKYGEVNVKFKNYYKYCFTFSTELPNGDYLFIQVGGNDGDIYRLDVDADEEYSVAELDPSSGTLYREGRKIGEYEY